MNDQTEPKSPWQLLIDVALRNADERDEVQAAAELGS